MLNVCMIVAVKKKLDLEIQKLEREVSISVHTVIISAVQCFNLCCFCSLYSRIQATKKNDCQIKKIKLENIVVSSLFH